METENQKSSIKEYQLIHYFNHGLKILTGSDVVTELNPCLLFNKQNGMYEGLAISEKPIMRDFSALKVVPIMEISPEKIFSHKCPGLSFLAIPSFSNESAHVRYYYLFEDLFKWHFDVFGLIAKGLAVNLYDIP